MVTATEGACQEGGPHPWPLSARRRGEWREERRAGSGEVPPLETTLTLALEWGRASFESLRMSGLEGAAATETGARG